MIFFATVKDFIATLSGLNRFDGTNFRVFYASAHDSSAIADNYVLHICEDHDRNIWCGTNKGVSRYNKSENSFSNYQLSSPFGLMTDANKVNEIICDRHGTVLCGTAAGIFEYDKTHDRFIGYYHSDSDSASPTSDHVFKNSFIEDPVKHGIWFSGPKGINFLDAKKGVL
jgi:ligand-binding sensor domain-containing protein